MDERSRMFLNNLYEEKIRHKEHRHTFVMHKLLFTIGLFGLGTLNKFPNLASSAQSLGQNSIELGLLVYMVPFVATAYDIYIFAEDFKIKRIGAFIRYVCSCSCPDECRWEDWLTREPSAIWASVGLTVLILLACVTLAYRRKADEFFYIWACISVILAMGVTIFGIRRRKKFARELNEENKKTKKSRGS